MNCQYCGKVGNYKFANGKVCCSDNISKCPAIRNKISLKRQNCIAWNKGKKCHPAWNAGKTFEELLGKEKADVYKQKIAKSRMGKIFTGLGGTEEKEKQRRKKISDNIKMRYENGWMPKAGRCKKIKYNSPYAGEVSLDGGWEEAAAKFLDSKNIQWLRNTKRFQYTHLNGKLSHYTPDFYLPDYMTYLEVKGYETDLDRCKWKQFPNKLIVWKKKEISFIKQGNDANWLSTLFAK